MSFKSFILSLWAFRPGLLALNIMLLVARTLAEGLGLILLVPLLALVGVASQGETSWFTDLLRTGFDRLGFDLSLRSVLLIFVALMVVRAVIGFAYNIAS
ncbi:MAG: hypothetical protein HKP56_14685, partial [Anderseniella sp.]|nr:hypothetical protein [Anderseniella sp.]